MSINEFLQKHKQPSYRLTQFNQAFYQNYISNFNELTVWPESLRELAMKQVEINPLKPIKELVSASGDTTKVLLQRKTNPKHFIEAVLMQHQDKRNTVCVSCMVGCPMNCSFCATGQMGFIANLTAAEIIAQVLYFARYLKNQKQKVTNIVFMGMGEPLINYLATKESIAVFTAKDKLALSPSRITLSTCGVIATLKQLIKDDFKGRLTISLHAPNQVLREQIMQVTKQNPLAELMTVLDQYVQATNKRVSYEYILIKELNDGPEQAEELVRLLKNRLAHVNLIPYNSVPGLTFQTPDKKSILAFASILEKAKLPHTIRVTMGADIQAACGQLATYISDM